MNDPHRPPGGFADLVGYQLGHWSAERAEVGLLVGAQHLNRSGVLHGGVLTTLIDTACGYAGCYAEDPAQVRRAFTLSLDCQFIATAPAGSHLTVLARKTGGGRQIFFAQAEVRDQDGRLIGQGTAVLRYRSAVAASQSGKGK